ncbi:MAG: hypothetical protein ACYSUT_07270 [Planctomycetota bacterium]|jgi:hypothetical protein
MYIMNSKRNITLLMGLVLVIISTIAVFSFGVDYETEGILIEPITAVYVEKDGDDLFRVAFAIVNNSKEELTFVTEGFDRGFRGIDKDTNALRCVLSFDREMNYKKEHRIVESIYKHAPVTLKPGEAAMVNYYEDYLDRGDEPDHDIFTADKIIISYQVSPFWAKRFNLWQGELQSVPVTFRKVKR